MAGQYATFAAARVAAPLTFSRSALAAADGSAPGTDFSNATTFDNLREPALALPRQIARILELLAQTHYEDQVGQGPYRAEVSPASDQRGVSGRDLATWIVDARDSTDAQGTAIRRVRIWELSRWLFGEPELASKIELDLYPPAVPADGAGLGQWLLRAQDGSDRPYLAAQASDRRRTGSCGSGPAGPSRTAPR